MRFGFFWRIVSAAAFALALALTGTLGRGAVAQVTQPSCAVESDPNTPNTVNAGDAFAIGLPSNKSTGYGWQLDGAPDPSVAQLLASVYVLPPRPATPIPLAGAGGRECWLFSATGSGQTTLTLDYLRPFDPPGTPPTLSETFTVTVQ